MSTIVIINASDLVTNSRADINTNFANLNADKFESSNVDTDTSLAANSDTKVPSQKAVKTYIDTQGGANASETVRGIVEEATDAEITAGSSTGGTGAKLFVTPAKLASSSVSPTKTVTAGETINGATTPVPVYQNKTDNEFYICDGNDLTKLKFTGFAVTNGSNGGNFSVQFSGVVGGFSALDEGEKYYLSDTAGSISTTIGTYEVLVGVAISTTQLLIQKGPRFSNGAGSYADSGGAGAAQNTAVSIGFRPSFIRMKAYLDTASEVVMASGTWANNVYAGVRYATDESAAAKSIATYTDGIIRIFDAGATDQWTITITSITDTGFTITVTQNVVTPTQIFVEWEVVGYH